MAGEKGKAVLVTVTEERVGELIAAALKGLVTDEQLKATIELLVTREQLVEAVGKLTDAAQGFVTNERLEEALKNLESAIELAKNAVSENQVKELIAGTQLAQLVPAGLLTTEEEEKPPLDPNWLKGLKFRTSEQTKDKTWHPVTRPLTPADVLNWIVAEDGIRIVTADGQRHTVTDL